MFLSPFHSFLSTSYFIREQQSSSESKSIIRILSHFTMARKRGFSDVSNDSDEWDGADEYVASGGSRKRRTTQRVKAGRKAKTRNADSLHVREQGGLASGSEEGSAPSLGFQDRPHPATIHRLSHPEPLRISLLAWYDKVHDARGMPWRKPYNSRFTLEERAQRAYEVLTCFSLCW